MFVPTCCVTVSLTAPPFAWELRRRAERDADIMPFAAYTALRDWPSISLWRTNPSRGAAAAIAARFPERLLALLRRRRGRLFIH